MLRMKAFLIRLLHSRVPASLEGWPFSFTARPLEMCKSMPHPKKSNSFRGSSPSASALCNKPTKMVSKIATEKMRENPNRRSENLTTVASLCGCYGPATFPIRLRAPNTERLLTATSKRLCALVDRLPSCRPTHGMRTAWSTTRQQPSESKTVSYLGKIWKQNNPRCHKMFRVQDHSDDMRRPRITHRNLERCPAKGGLRPKPLAIPCGCSWTQCRTAPAVPH